MRLFGNYISSRTFASILPSSGPICKALLPFQRRRITSLSAYKGNEAHLRQLLPKLDNLHTLHCSAKHDVPPLLSLLPKPSRLIKRNSERDSPLLILPVLYDQYPSVSSSLAIPLASFTAFEVLRLGCPCDLGSPEMHEALRKTSLIYFGCEPETRDSIKLDDFVPLVKGSGHLPHLETLELSFVFAEAGNPASEVHPSKAYVHFYDCWDLAKWPQAFSRADLERLVEICEATGRVALEGTAVDAMQVEDFYEEEKEEMDRKVEEYFGPSKYE